MRGSYERLKHTSMVVGMPVWMKRAVKEAAAKQGIAMAVMMRLALLSHLEATLGLARMDEFRRNKP